MSALSGIGGSGDVLAASPNASVLAGLRVDGLDIDRARHMVGARAARRLRRRHLTLGGIAAVSVVALATLLWPSPKPQRVVVADDATTSTTSSTTAPTTTVTAVALTTVPPTTTPSSTTTATPSITTVPTTVPATTAPPPNRPLTATAQVTDQAGTPTTNLLAGDTVWAVVNWNDPDAADPTNVDVRVDFGDQLLTTTEPEVPRPPCNVPGAGASGQAKVPFRYSMAGAATLTVTVAACNGNGPYGERVSVPVVLRVGAPAAGSRVVVLAGVADGFSGDAADVLISGIPPIPKRVPELHQRFKSDGKAATTALIPSSFAGTVTLRWTTPSLLCQSTIAPVQPTSDGSTANAPLAAGPPSTCPAGQVAGSPTSP